MGKNKKYTRRLKQSNNSNAAKAQNCLPSIPASNGKIKFPIRPGGTRTYIKGVGLKLLEDDTMNARLNAPLIRERKQFAVRYIINGRKECYRSDRKVPFVEKVLGANDGKQKGEQDELLPTRRDIRPICAPEQNKNTCFPKYEVPISPSTPSYTTQDTMLSVPHPSSQLTQDTLPASLSWAEEPINPLSTTDSVRTVYNLFKSEGTEVCPLSTTDSVRTVYNLFKSEGSKSFDDPIQVNDIEIIPKDNLDPFGFGFGKGSVEKELNINAPRVSLESV